MTQREKQTQTQKLQHKHTNMTDKMTRYKKRDIKSITTLKLKKNDILFIIIIINKIYIYKRYSKMNKI